MRADELIPSKFLKQSDVMDEPTVTVHSLKKENVAQADEEPDYKYTVKFKEFEKPLVLNSTNTKRMAKALGDDTDDWPNGKVILYVDPDVEYAGKVTGGIRVRSITRNGTAARKDEPSADDVNRKARDAAADEDVPF